MARTVSCSPNVRCGVRFAGSRGRGGSLRPALPDEVEDVFQKGIDDLGVGIVVGIPFREAVVVVVVILRHGRSGGHPAG